MLETETEVHNTLAAINSAWREGQPDQMAIYLHQAITMKLPGFSGKISGRETLINSFIEFCTNAVVLEYSESDEQIDVTGNCAVATFKFEMIYEREKYRDKLKGRDIWIFEREGNKWIAVWRTMIDLDETRIFEK